MTLALAVVFGGYAVVMLAVAGRLAVQRRRPAAPDEALPTVAVVVAARNEEARIGRCLDALRALDYPAGRLEIVVADDHSTDGTAKVVYQRAGEDSGHPVRYVRVPAPEGPLRGKAQALHTAIETVSAEVVLITDADCAPVASWARTLAAAFADDAVGLACGLARVEPRPGRAFDAVQALDWELLLGTVAAAASVGHPATGMGNNMAVRRAAYEAVGGYPALPFSVTEDFILVQALAGAGWRVQFDVEAPSVVWTLPVNGVAEAYGQRRRWARGGLSASRWVVPLYGVLFGVHALLVAGLALAPAAGLAALATKAVADGAVLASVRRRVGGRVRIGALLGTVAFVTGYLVTLPFALVLRPRIGWKGRSH